VGASGWIRVRNRVSVGNNTSLLFRHISIRTLSSLLSPTKNNKYDTLRQHSGGNNIYLSRIRSAEVDREKSGDFLKAPREGERGKEIHTHIRKYGCFRVMVIRDVVCEEGDSDFDLGVG